MNQSIRRVGIILFLLLWFFLISLPAFAMLLTVRGQIQLGQEDNRLRVFLLQEQDAEGVGFELARPYRPNDSCDQISLRYIMWVGEPKNVTFCQCIETGSRAALPATPGACVPP